MPKTNKKENAKDTERCDGKKTKTKTPTEYIAELDAGYTKT